VPKYTDAVTPDQVAAAGAIGLGALSNGSAEVLQALRQAYASSVRNTLILSLAAACIAFPASCGMEWFNIKHVAQERERLGSYQEGQREKSGSTEQPRKTALASESDVEREA